MLAIPKNSAETVKLITILNVLTIYSLCFEYCQLLNMVITLKRGFLLGFIHLNGEVMAN